MIPIRPSLKTFKPTAIRGLNKQQYFVGLPATGRGWMSGPRTPNRAERRAK